MEKLRFDGRTAIITGAGGNPGLGRAHALLLAERGANVVVNDIGRDPESLNMPGSASAEGVAAEIRALGGNAVADTHSVANEEGSKAVVQTALDAFGSVDILVNNAAISNIAPFDVLSSRDLQRHIDINLMGQVWMCRAAWPHMREKGYGRIVNICSAAFAGSPGLVAYGTSKGGSFSLTRTLAAEGASLGIKVNAVNPGAFTRLVMSVIDENTEMYKKSQERSKAELVSPVVAFLAHEDCPVSGELLHAAGGTVGRIHLVQNPGFNDPELTIEKIVDRWGEVMGDRDPLELGFMPEIASSARPYQSAEKI